MSGDDHAAAVPPTALNRTSPNQQLRSHLAYLKLAAVAEHLPVALEQAGKDKPGYTHAHHEQIVRVTAQNPGAAPVPLPVEPVQVGVAKDG